MTITASGILVANFVNALKNTLALDLDAATLKLALFSDTIAPNFDTDTAYAVAPYNANEVTGTGWPAGGVALASPTLSVVSGAMAFDAADISASGCTFTGAMGALIYDDALSPKSGICLVDFVTAYSPTAGTFSIVWGSSIFTLDLTP